MTYPLERAQLDAAKAMDKELELLARDLEERRLDLQAEVVRELDAELRRLRDELTLFRAGQLALFTE